MTTLLVGLALGAEVSGGGFATEATQELYGAQAARRRHFCHLRVEVDRAGRVADARIGLCSAGFEEPSVSVLERSAFHPVRVDGEPSAAWLDVTVMWQGGHPRSWVNLVIPLPTEEVPPQIEVLMAGQLTSVEMARIGGAECVFSVLVDQEAGLRILDVERCPEHLENLARQVAATSVYSVEGSVPARLAVTFELDNPAKVSFLPTRLPPQLTEAQNAALSAPRLAEEPVGYPAKAERKVIYGLCPLRLTLDESGRVASVAVDEACPGEFSRHARLLVEGSRYFPVPGPTTLERTLDYCIPVATGAGQDDITCSPWAHTPVPEAR